MKNIFLFWFILLSALTTSSAQPPTFFVTPQNEGIYAFKEKLEILEDSSTKLVYPLVKKQSFAGLKKFKKKINPRYAYWGRITLKSHLVNRQNFILYLGSANFCDAFIETGNQVIKEQAGRLVPLSKKKVKEGRNVAIPIFLPQQSQVTIYFRFKNIDNRPPKFKPALYTQLAWHDKFKTQHLIQISFLTLLWTLVVYQLTLFVLTRQIYYLHSLLCFFLLPVFFLATSGVLTQYLLGEYPKVNEVTYMLALGLLNTIYPMLNRSFVNTSHYLKTWDNIFQKITFLSALQLAAVVALLTINFNLGLALKIIIFGTIIPTISNLIFAIEVLRQNIKASKIYAIGILQLSFFFIVNLGQVILHNTSSNDLSLFMLGLAIQGVFFTVALAQRMKIAEEEKHQAKTEQLRIISKQNDLLEHKVIERTLELSKKNSEIVAQNEELQQQQDEIEAQRDAIVAQRDQLDETYQLLQENNTLIRQSIRAAQNIQEAMLPSKAYMQQLIPDHFVIYEPRDVVSGDFYWIERVENKVFIAAVDCTGHGVPGAFMSMVANTLLDHIIKLNKIFDPAQILRLLHEGVKEGLKQEQSGNRSGMDLALVVLNEPSNNKVQVQFAGAKRPLHYIQNNHVQTIKGSRLSIGGVQNNCLSFEAQSICLPKGTHLYFGSDGLADQNNAQRKKVGLNHLKQNLLANHRFSMSQQKQRLKQMLKKHMEGTNQRDDILWIGVKL